MTIVGLGPGEERLLTVEAQRVLRRAREVWVRYRGDFPAFLEATGKVRDLGQSGEATQAIVEEIIRLARRPQGVVYAVWGNPLVGQAIVPLLVAAAKAESLPARVVVGMSYLDSWPGSGFVDSARLQLLHAGVLAGKAGRTSADDVDWPRLVCPQLFVATAPLSVFGLNEDLVEGVQQALLESYPPAHKVMLTVSGRLEERPLVVPLEALADVEELTENCFLLVPALDVLDDLRSFSTFRHIVARLRAPGGCPWDREQTHESLKPYLVEESYEVLEALDEADLGKLEEELGDLLLQVVLHSQLAAESASFSIEDVLAHISAKLIRRHPHVFGDRVVADSTEVVRNWEAIKRAEKGAEEVASLLGGVPKDMPALAHSASIQRRVADVGFEWRDTASAMAKVVEELGELERAETPEERRVEFGDLLFAIVSAGRRMGIDAEEALRLANTRFMRRFARLEALARDRDLALKNLSPDQLVQLWREAK